MPTISAKIIKWPRKQRKCADCNQAIEGPQLRLYGYAEPGDRPYSVYLHPGCEQSDEVKRKLEANEKLCAACGHSDGRHQTAGGFCKHCTCNAFVEPK